MHIAIWVTRKHFFCPWSFEASLFVSKGKNILLLAESIHIQLFLCTCSYTYFFITEESVSSELFLTYLCVSLLVIYGSFFFVKNKVFCCVSINKKKNVTEEKLMWMLLLYFNQPDKIFISYALVHSPITKSDVVQSEAQPHILI